MKLPITKLTHFNKHFYFDLEKIHCITVPKSFYDYKTKELRTEPHVYIRFNHGKQLDVSGFESREDAEIWAREIVTAANKQHMKNKPFRPTLTFFLCFAAAMVGVSVGLVVLMVVHQLTK